MTLSEHIKYWQELAQRDYPVMENLFENSHYMWSLYIGHLILEKVIKARYIFDNETIPPKTHDLVKLIKSTKLNVSEDNLIFLNKVNDFNIETRYTDFKSKLYNECNKEFTEINLNKIKEIYQWIKTTI